MNFKLHLKAKLVISESDTAMMTKRLLNQTWLIFIGTVLGSVFGLMGTIAALMRLTENFSDRFEKKYVRKVNLKEKILKNITLIQEFSIYQRAVIDRKVVPMKYEINETQEVTKNY